MNVNFYLIKKYCSILLIIILILTSGCASTLREYDYSALRARNPRSILVIPPVNESIDVNASYIYLSTVSRPLAEKGYYVFPVAVIDTFLKENGLPTPVEMNSIPLAKIKEHIGADAVLYVHINDWGQKYQVLSSKAIVNANLRLVDVDSGVVLWEGTAYAQQESGNNDNSLAVKLLSAVVEQIASSIADHTPELSRIANYNAFYNDYGGLLDGPYIIKDR